MKKFAKNKVLPLILSAVMFFAIYEFAGIKNQNPAINKPTKNTNTKLKGIEINFLDVGQGDCALITLENGTDILIDGGDVKTQSGVVNFLKDNTDGKIDYLIASHPHADHIGGLDDVLNEYEVGEVILPKIANGDLPTTKVYENLLTAIKQNGCKVKRAKAGLTIYNRDDCVIECLGPSGDNYSSLNDYSAIIKVTYGEFSAIFTGDAEVDAEEELLLSEYDLSADVLKVGHHGSNTANGKRFLEKVKPRYAIISVGYVNDYGHPHAETLARLGKAGCKIYRTDYSGTITVTSDKKDISVITEKSEF